MIYHTKIKRSELASQGNLKTLTCPICGKSLINLLGDNENQREFWCDCTGETYLIDIVEDED